MAENSHVTVSLDPASYSALPFPKFSQPSEVGHFSLSTERTLIHDRSQLKRFDPPVDVLRINGPDDLFYRQRESLAKLKLNLSDGYESWIFRDDNAKEYIDPIFRWLLHRRSLLISNLPPANGTHEEEKESSRELPSLADCCEQAEFVCWRGLLSKLAATPFAPKDDWIVNIVRFQDIFFLVEIDTEKVRLERLSMTDRQRQMTYWGYKFEQIVSKDPGSSDSFARRALTMPVNSCEQFCNIYRTKLTSVSFDKRHIRSEHRLLYGAEMDCVDDKGNQIELKTNRIIETDRQHQNLFRFKLLKCWLQCFLVGITRLIFGFRDDDGRLLNLAELSTEEIPKMAATILPDAWKPNVCFNFLHQLLSFVKDKIPLNDPIAVYQMRYESRRQYQGIIFELLPDGANSAGSGFEFFSHTFLREFA